MTRFLTECVERAGADSVNRPCRQRVHRLTEEGGDIFLRQ